MQQRTEVEKRLGFAAVDAADSDVPGRGVRQTFSDGVRDVGLTDAGRSTQHNGTTCRPDQSVDEVADDRLSTSVV